jgi:hypothetical protein
MKTKEARFLFKTQYWVLGKNVCRYNLRGHGEGWKRNKSEHRISLHKVIA